MGRSKKYHKYTTEQLTELATLNTRKELRRFSRLTKHSYTSVYGYWRKITGKKLTDVDPKVKRGAPRKNSITAPFREKANTFAYSKTNAVYVNIKSLHVITNENGQQQLVITY